MLDEVYDSMKEAVEKAHQALGRDLAKLRTGRANLAILDGIRADYYGQPTPLNQMASISVPEPRLIVIRPWDKAALQAAEKAILTSDIGLTPNSDGEFIRLPIPPLTEERRKELVKVARKHAEECKIAIRHARRDANEMLETFKDDGDIPEDDAIRGKKHVQELTDEAIKKVDEIVARKEEDIMEV
jgi:ribosome recycling factor